MVPCHPRGKGLFFKFKKSGFRADGAGEVSNSFTMCKQQLLIAYLFFKVAGWKGAIWKGGIWIPSEAVNAFGLQKISLPFVLIPNLSMLAFLLL